MITYAGPKNPAGDPRGFQTPTFGSAQDFRHPPSDAPTGIPDTHLRMHPHAGRSFRANPGSPVFSNTQSAAADASGKWVKMGV